MFRVGLLLFAVINVRTTLAKHTTVPADIVSTKNYEEFWQQHLPSNDPVYRPSSNSRRSVDPSMGPIQTTTEYTPVNTEKNTNDTSTAVATGRTNPSWWSNISSGIISAYDKVTSYTGPYLLPSLLVILLIGVINTLICTYTSICNSSLSAVALGAKQASHHSSPYLDLIRIYSSSRFCKHCQDDIALIRK